MPARFIEISLKASIAVDGIGTYIPDWQEPYPVFTKKDFCLVLTNSTL